MYILGKKNEVMVDPADFKPKLNIIRSCLLKKKLPWRLTCLTNPLMLLTEKNVGLKRLKIK